jgi:hypothetical protein
VDGAFATCFNGMWTWQTGGCIAQWPKYPDKNCDDHYASNSKSVFTPILEEATIVTTSGYVANRDHLYLRWYVNASYGVLGVTGTPNAAALPGVPVPGTPRSLLAPDTIGTTSTNDLWYRFSLTGCRGVVEMRIPIGLLDEWGFRMTHDTTGWYLEGQFFVNETRLTLTGDRIETQLLMQTSQSGSS